jgi:hypothetical protein
MLNLLKLATVLFAIAMSPAHAAADYKKISDKSEFLALVAGKTLTRPLVKLEVLTSGKIAGRGATWDIEGNWTWKDGYFCRDLFWGGDEIGYNCQEVGLSNARVRFTSDKGKGDSAEFRLQ